MIEGVIIKDLITHKDERGFFREIFRFSSEFRNVPVGQLSHSLVREGVIKAWHGHTNQAQWNYVVTGQLKVALFDNREGSKTYHKTMEFRIGEEGEANAYYFPKGILHGYKCMKGPLHIIYVTSGIYDLEDEIRHPYDSSDIGYDWVNEPEG